MKEMLGNTNYSRENTSLYPGDIRRVKDMEKTAEHWGEDKMEVAEWSVYLIKYQSAYIPWYRQML